MEKGYTKASNANPMQQQNQDSGHLSHESADNYCQHGENVVILQYTRKGYGHPLLCLRYASVVALLS